MFPPDVPGHYFGEMLYFFPHLLSRKLSGRWTPFPIALAGPLFERWPYAVSPPEKKGPYVFFRTRKREWIPLKKWNPFDAQAHGHVVRVSDGQRGLDAMGCQKRHGGRYRPYCAVCVNASRAAEMPLSAAGNPA